MNDHVGKPFDLDHLVATLLRLTGRADTSNGGAAPHRAGLPAELMAEASRRSVDLAGALHRLGGNSAVYLRLLKSFTKDLPTLPAQLATLLPPGQPGERAQAARLMHTFKGLAGTLGLQALAALAADAEKRLLGAETAGQHAALHDELSAALPSTMHDIAHVAEALAHASGRAEPVAEAQPIDRAGLRQRLAELAP